MQDQVADLADDWPECLEMVAEQKETPKLHEFLGLLVPRLERMKRQFNWVKYKVLPEGKIWQINNYDYKMYYYMTNKYQDSVTVTPYSLTICDGDLNEVDRDLLRRQL